MKDKTRDITLTAMFAALSFLLTMFGKVPNPVGGYYHVGDSMLILAVIILGTKRGAVSGSVGAALADLLGGFAIWCVPTLIIKTVWALIIGLFAYHILKNYKYGWIVGTVIGGAVHAFLYSVVYAWLFGQSSLALAIPGEIAQASVGTGAALLIYFLMAKSGALSRIRAYAVHIQKG